MDLSAACAGFMYGMITAKQFIETGTYKNVLVVGSEKLSKITRLERSKYSSIIWGWSRCYRNGDVSEGKGIFSFEFGADGSGGKHLYQDEYVMMNGREVFKFAVRQMGESVFMC